MFYFPKNVQFDAWFVAARSLWGALDDPRESAGHNKSPRWHELVIFPLSVVWNLSVEKCYFCLQVLLPHCLDSTSAFLRPLGTDRHVVSTNSLEKTLDDFVDATYLSEDIQLNLSNQIHCEKLTCPQCFFTSFNKLEYQNHVKSHQFKTSQCPYCAYTTTRNDHLKIHIRCHTGEKPYHCKECNYKSTQKSHLNVHMQKWHRSQPPGSI